MKKFIAGIVAGLVLATTSVGVAAVASDRDWKRMENEGVSCSLGKYGTSVETSAVCGIFSAKHGYTVSMDSDLGIQVHKGNRVLFQRGSW